MSKKIVVPDGMRKAARGCESPSLYAVLDCCVENVAHWLSENPIVPTDEQVKAIAVPHYHSVDDFVTGAKKNAMVEWQRLMFRRPEPLEAIQDLLKHPTCCVYTGDDHYRPEITYSTTDEEVNRRVFDAYKRGQNSK